MLFGINFLFREAITLSKCNTTPTNLNRSSEIIQLSHIKLDCSNLAGIQLVFEVTFLMVVRVTKRSERHNELLPALPNNKLRTILETRVWFVSWRFH